jgi:hypothetical protein
MTRVGTGRCAWHRRATLFAWLLIASAKERDDAAEQANAGKAWTDLSQEALSACKAEGGGAASGINCPRRPSCPHVLRTYGNDFVASTRTYEFAFRRLGEQQAMPVIHPFELSDLKTIPGQFGKRGASD